MQEFRNKASGAGQDDRGSHPEGAQACVPGLSPPRLWASASVPLSALSALNSV